MAGHTAAQRTCKEWQQLLCGSFEATAECIDIIRVRRVIVFQCGQPSSNPRSLIDPAGAVHHVSLRLRV